jgi:hypothetical protein
MSGCANRSAAFVLILLSGCSNLQVEQNLPNVAAIVVQQDKKTSLQNSDSTPTATNHKGRSKVSPIQQSSPELEVRNQPTFDSTALTLD